MRHGRALPGLVILLLAGCVTGGAARPDAAPERAALLDKPGHSDVVYLFVALVERPVGDRYLNLELWGLADEQAVSVERRAVLEENGFRIARVGGILPTGLQGLLSSERSCVNPHCVQVHAGHPTSVSLGAALAACRFEVHANGHEAPVALERALCSLVVTPTLGRDGRTSLHFTPEVQHGEPLSVPRPVADPSGVYNWELHEQRPTETYDTLGWDVALGPNECVLVGGRYDRPDTLGHCCFLCREPPYPAQRLLVIRAGRAPEPDDTAAGAAEAEENRSTAQEVPPALQAFYTAARGYRP